MVNKILILRHQLSILLLLLVFPGCGLFMVDLTPQKPLIPIDELNGKITFSSDRETINTKRDDGAYGIFLMNANGSGLKKLSPPQEEQYLIEGDIWSLCEDCPVFTPSGGKILFTHYITKKGTELWVMNADGTDRKCIIDGKVSDKMDYRSGIDWSPDGTQIIVPEGELTDEHDFIESLALIKDIYSMPRIVRIYNDQSSTPKWSPDGEKIAFYGLSKWKIKPGGSDHEIFIMNKDGSNITNITNNRSRDASPAWSPDGNKVAFVSSRDGGNHIYIMDADGSNVRQITDGNYACDSPVWSPDGKYIAYCRSLTSPLCEFEIWVTTADGTMERQLTKRVKFKYGWSTDQRPDWR
jgi:Tol biopolymer transport system component